MKSQVRCKPGFTILECLIYISVSSFLLTIVAIWLHKILLFSSAQAERQQDRGNFLRLSAALRQDVQFASDWTMDDSDELILQMNNKRRIHYRLVEEPHQTEIQMWQVDHDPSNGERSLGAETIMRRDYFRFTPQCQLAWEKSEFPQWLSLIATRRPFLQPNNSPDPKLQLSDFPTAAERRRKTNSESSESSRTPDWPSLAFKPPVEMNLKLSVNRWQNRVIRSNGEESRQ